MTLLPSYLLAQPVFADVGDGPLMIGYPIERNRQELTGRRPLADLLGRTRAAVLGAVNGGRNTTDLAQTVGTSIASASEHAAVLRSAGLISTHRTGPAVLHSLTPLGESLLRRPTARGGRLSAWSSRCSPGARGRAGDVVRPGRFGGLRRDGRAGRTAGRARRAGGRGRRFDRRGGGAGRGRAARAGGRGAGGGTGRGPVIAGVGAPTGRQAAGFTTEAVAAGADGVLALSPPRVPDPRAYYEAVAKAAAAVPLLAYHFPAVSSPGIAVDLLPGLPIAGIKDSSATRSGCWWRLERLDGAVYVGSSVMLSMAGAVGAHGAILTLANYVPELCIAAYGGEGAAQREMLGTHLRGSRNFPAGIKSLVAERFGTSTYARIGSMSCGGLCPRWDRVVSRGGGVFRCRPRAGCRG